MANLAIEGHSTQGSEVIARLKMLGGMNTFNLNGSETNCYYYIDNNNRIYHCLGIDPRNYIYYTFEEFLEKFPYKVGDTVLYKPDNTPYFIIKMFWKNDKVLYELSDKINLEACSTSYTIIPDVDVVKLQPYKEETMERKYNVEEYLEVWEETENGLEVVVNNNFELKEDNGKFYIIKKQLQYPKTYKECCRIIDYYLTGATIIGYEKPLLENLQRLLICRDAYWKIAGTEMGLDKPWKQDYDDRCFIIANNNGNIHTYEYHGTDNIILAFPTAKMRDTFYENFKDLIEQCKELL